MLSIDDAINSSLGIHVTWKQVFSNTAGSDGSHAGTLFEYSNEMWSHVSEFIEELTGVTFVEAITHYILKPIGVSGYFDKDTEYPPMTARGFRGSNEDLLVIGSTLASGGVSPKTRLRVISSISVKNMLRDWTRTQNVIASFKNDKTMKTMDRFANNGSIRASNGNIVTGYGMGLWHVKGWRTKGSNGSAVQGWLSMGSSEALLYFDEDGLVVAMCAKQRKLGLELTAPLKEIVRELGSRLNTAYDSGAPKHDSQDFTQGIV